MPFKVGEKVVYPNHGVGVIEQITHNSLNGRAEEFYLIRILSNSLRVTIPCVNADCVGLRRIIKSADVPRVLSRLRNGKTESPRAARRRRRGAEEPGGLEQPEGLELPREEDARAGPGAARGRARHRPQRHRGHHRAGSAKNPRQVRPPPPRSLLIPRAGLSPRNHPERSEGSGA